LAVFYLSEVCFNDCVNLQCLRCAVHQILEYLPQIMSAGVLIVLILLTFITIKIAGVTREVNNKSQEIAALEKLLLSEASKNQANQQFIQQSLMQHQQQIADFKMKLLRQHAEQGEKQQVSLQQHQTEFAINQAKAVEQLTTILSKQAQQNREEQANSLKSNTEQLNTAMEKLSKATDERLQQISEQVEKRLADGFDKTTKTFNDILKRLALIDDAQKKITELSSNVVSLQEVLADKRSRGAFGEVQLTALIRNVIPEKHFSLQHTLSNGKIADCLLLLPEPTGNVVVDAKFPLESYRRMTQLDISESDKKLAERQFKQDIKKHINDISDKYLIEKETSDGALMFLPAEAIFAEIHGHYPELVEYANDKRVWIVSPTTLMAILTTARAVIKDKATQEQVHIIQAHLSELSKDFSRFRTRFDNLAKHIDQAAVDVKQIHTSAGKISNRFEKIEQVNIDEGSTELLQEQSLI
jgi:DNA recombination protein RmuC